MPMPIPEFEPFIKAALELIVESGTKVLGRAYYEARKRIDLPGDRREIITEFLLNRGDFLFHPSSDYNPAPGQSAAPNMPTGYPHDIQALLAFEPFLPDNAKLMDSSCLINSCYHPRAWFALGVPKRTDFRGSIFLHMQ